MTDKTKNILSSSLKENLPDIRPGDTVKVYQKIKEGKQDKTQVFEGEVLAKKHGKGLSAAITVRKVASGVGMEKIFPLHSPVIEKIEIVKRGKVKRAKLYYLREAKGKRAKLKTKEFSKKQEVKTKEEPKEETEDQKKEEK